jgi:hypothetical protein
MRHDILLDTDQEAGEDDRMRRIGEDRLNREEYGVGGMHGENVFLYFRTIPCVCV